jgi:L-histidine N-alpha-methyltransferase
MSRARYRIECVRDEAGRVARMAQEVRRGLTARPPWLPSKYFYDDRGSRLFEAITVLPEYYQTRTEEQLLAVIADEVAERTRPVELVELGSGSGRKVRLLLEAARRHGRLQRCVLLEINARFLGDSARSLAEAFPGLAVRGVVGDFTVDLCALGAGGGRLVVFFAGTIGNLEPAEARDFLSRIARQLSPGDALLVGVDLVKTASRLEAAYNDAAGVTAEFNRNILRVLNAELGANLDADRFDHVAFYDPRRVWIEMRLRATRRQNVRVPAADLDLVYRVGDEIRTEISCKYTRASFEALLQGTGLAADRWFTDAERLFALALLVRVPSSAGIAA